jgi:hypothetical protein
MVLSEGRQAEGRGYEMSSRGRSTEHRSMTASTGVGMGREGGNKVHSSGVFRGLS